MGRITGDMKALVAIYQLSGDSQKAFNICLELFQGASIVDPDAISASRYLVELDGLGIYDDRIVKFWEMCDRHVGRMHAVLRAYQHGQVAGVNEQTLNHAIDNGGEGIDIDAAIAAVKKMLPMFDPDIIKTGRRRTKTA